MHASEDARPAAPTAVPLPRPWAWAGLVLAALLVAIVLRLFVAEAFRIPTASMAQTLEAGDFILVSKLHYGARTPERLGVPFTAWTVPGVRLPSVRLPGLARVRRGDVVVFHHPGEAGLVSERTPYVKRIAGLPGDTVALRDKRLVVNGTAAAMPATAQHDWIVTFASDSAAVAPEAVVGRAGLRAWRVRATAARAEALAGHADVEAVEPAAGRPEGALFPPGTAFTPDDFGPLIVPRRGVPLRITEALWPAVRATLEREGRHAERLGPGRYEIDGRETDTVTFGRDYYFVLGDNRDDSADSRRWGFVPADHLIGKAVLVYFSVGEEGLRPGRMFRCIR